MVFFLECIENIFSNLYLLFFVTCIALGLKGYILVKLVSLTTQKLKLSHIYLLLILVLVGSMVIDLSWVFCLIRILLLPTPYSIYLFFLRMAWAFMVLQFQSLTLFLEKLVEQNPGLNTRQKSFIFTSVLFFCATIVLACTNYGSSQTERPLVEYLLRNLQIYYLLFIMIPYAIGIVLWKTYTKRLPRILKKQIKVILPTTIIPMYIFELLQTFPIILIPTVMTNSYSAVCFSTFLLTATIYYCTRRVTDMRFLNLTNHVEVATRHSFITNFKEVLGKLSIATSINEIHNISQSLFKDSFSIPLNKTHLYVRHKKKPADQTFNGEKKQTIRSLTEDFLDTCWNDQHMEEQRNAKILIYDEIEFDNFYENTTSNVTTLAFLEAINADIFIPIYEKGTITAFIIVERYARPDTLYGAIERNEMLVYAGYLGNIIHLFQTYNLETLAQKEKELQDELYIKHQQVNQYKESINSFLKNANDKEIGIIFYQNRRFIFGNKSARDMVQINVNAQEGHPLTRALRQVARQVEEYKAPVKQFALDHVGNKIVLAGVPNLEKNNVIITIYYPEISDLIRKQAQHISDPTQWDYLLYLETTESGKLINKLIPGSGEVLLSFKINLLKVALSKRAILLEVPAHDLMPTVELIHHISLRDRLHCLKLTGAHRANNETAVKLFGINPLFSSTEVSKPLLEELDEHGTLFIENVHLLSIETQEYLAEFLKCGMFRAYKSNQKKSSSARIICSTNQNLQTLTHEGTFSRELYTILKKGALTMPSLLTIAEDELCALAEGFTEQSLKSLPLKNLLELTEIDKTRLANTRPTSIHELKEKVQYMLAHKSKKNSVHEETQFSSSYDSTDPLLMQAARLGKHALRDSKIMAMLWNKFKSQAKIATFLGVNRSSVNRRCKDYHLNTPKDNGTELDS